jgi:alanine-alpha-ketoisovalerate/valine-pyruvate aminotransferase
MSGVALTVDGDGNALREDKAVSALEGGNLAELVELQVLGRDTLRRLSLDELNVEAILLRDGQERGRAWVTLSDSC